MNPEMLKSLENVDPDQLFREIWFANSSSMNALKDPMEVEQEREEKAEAMARQQQLQQLPAIADAAQKVSGAVSPDSILNQLEG
jgi:hypothetical protein